MTVDKAGHYAIFRHHSLKLAMGLLSKSTEYALRAVLYVASRKDAKYVSIREISDELGVSFHFLTKILQRLTRKGLVVSYRGPGGGVALARPAGRITLMDIVEAVEESDLFTSCILGLAGCGEKKPCPLHGQWARERTGLGKMFRQTTIAKLAGHVVRDKLRLADG